MKADSSPRGASQPGQSVPGSGQPGSAGGEPTWYVAVGDQVYGPADLPTLRRWMASGRITTATQVRAAGGDSWCSMETFPELRDLRMFGASRPLPQPAPTHLPVEAALSAVAPCPHCRGPVLNIAPPYGWPWGIWQRALRPQFVCTSCGARLRLGELPAAAQAEVARKKRVAWAWIIVTTLFILIIASPFLVALVSE